MSVFSWLTGRLSSGTDADHGFSRLTLRFFNGPTEAAFSRRNQELLVQRTKTLCWIGLVVTGLTLMYNAVVLKQYQRKVFLSDVGYETTRVSILALLAAGIILVLFCGSLYWKRLLKNASPATLEIACIGIMIFTMVVSVLRSPERVAKMLGWSVEEAFGSRYFSDSHALLTIDGIITAAHLGFPVRWCSMFPLELAGILLYVVLVFGVGSNEPLQSNVWSLGFLVCLVVAAALGKRAAEIEERQHFMDIIKERSLRCDAEFELSQSTRQGRPRAQDLLSESRKSTQESGAGTTPASLIFNLMSEASNMVETLTCVAKLGDTEHWRIKESEVRCLPGKVLGCGGFGKVVMGVFCGVMVAIKFPLNKLKSSDMCNLSDLCNELRVLRHVRHPNIAAIHGAIVAPGLCKIALVIEFVEGMVLNKFVTHGPEGKQPDRSARYSLMVGVCNALLYLHTRCPHIVHGDVKGSNIVVELFPATVHAKLLDFGMSRVLTPNAKRLGGTLAYVAPEVFAGDASVRCSADIYSFGRLTAFIATSFPPLSDISTDAIRAALKRRRPPPPSWPEGCAFEPSCKKLVLACIHAEEQERPDISEVHAELLNLPRRMDLAEGVSSLAAQLREPTTTISVEAADVNEVDKRQKPPALPATRAEPAQPDLEGQRRTPCAAQDDMAGAMRCPVSL